MGIDTGRFSGGCADKLVASSIVYGSANVVFSNSVPYNNEESFIFDVKPGQLLVFDAYNIPDGGGINLERLVTGSRKSVSNGSVSGVMNPHIVSSTSVLYWKPMEMFGAARWQLRPDKSIMVLSMPGTYRWKLSDETMLDSDLYVEYNVYSVDSQIPREFWNGGLGL